MKGEGGMDGLDALMASLTDDCEKKVKTQKDMSSSVKQQDIDKANLDPIVTQRKETDPRVLYFTDSLRQFSLDVADPATRHKINKELAGKTFEELVTSSFVPVPIVTPVAQCVCVYLLAL